MQQIIDAEQILFRMLKGGVDKNVRDSVGRLIGSMIQERVGNQLARPGQQPLSPGDRQLLAEMERIGFSSTSPLFSPAQLDSIDHYFGDKPISFSNGDIDTKDTVLGFLKDRPEQMRFGHWNQDTVTACPAFAVAAHDDRLLEIAEAYLGAPPTITILTAWWSFPSTARIGGMQNFHHDRDDFRMLKLFAYLTDTTVETGPHEFVDETHTFGALLGVMGRRQWPDKHSQMQFLQWMEMHRKNEADVRKYFPQQNIRTIVGPRGSTFFEDTRGLHRGVPPEKGARWAFEFCYSLLPKSNAQYTPLPRPPEVTNVSARAAYATRLFYK